MKTKILLFSLAVFASTSLFAVTHGSIIKKNVPVNIAIDTRWQTQPFPVATAVLDFKAVTIGGRLWAKVVGTGYELYDKPWGSQIRIITPSYHEISVNNDGAYVVATPATNTTIVTAYPFTAINQLSVCQADHDSYYGTETWNFDAEIANSGLTGDTERPILTKANIGTQAGTTVEISCTASDNSGDYFYLVTDVTNNYYYASFDNDFTITNLNAGTTYNLSIVAVDYSGNESVGITTALKETNSAKMSLSQNNELIAINSPEAVKFIKLYSTNGQLIASETSTNTIGTSKLAKGTYVLKAEDIQGVRNTFKVVVK